MAHSITVDAIALHHLVEIPVEVEQRQRLHEDIRHAGAPETFDGIPDAPQGYRLRIDAETEHGALLHFPIHHRAVLVWSGTRRLMDFCPTWRDAVRTFFGPEVALVAGLGIRD